MQEMWVQSLGWEDPLEKEMAYPLQCSCLENPTKRGAWWAIAHGVEMSQTQPTTEQQTSIGITESSYYLFTEFLIGAYRILK